MGVTGKATGLIHLYTGDGKGKTTAAIGLSIRAAGAGMKVCFVQFLKDGTSSEIEVLRQQGVQVITGGINKFWFQMDETEKKELVELHNRFLTAAIQSGCDLLVLDEACAAVNLGAVDEKLMKESVLGKPDGREVVLTGRDAPEWIIESADYLSEIFKVKHPYDKGVQARKGIEF